MPRKSKSASCVFRRSIVSHPCGRQGFRRGGRTRTPVVPVVWNLTLHDRAGCVPSRGEAGYGTRARACAGPEATAPDVPTTGSGVRQPQASRGPSGGARTLYQVAWRWGSRLGLLLMRQGVSLFGKWSVAERGGFVWRGHRCGAACRYEGPPETEALRLAVVLGLLCRSFRAPGPDASLAPGAAAERGLLRRGWALQNCCSRNRWSKNKSRNETPGKAHRKGSGNLPEMQTAEVRLPQELIKAPA